MQNPCCCKLHALPNTAALYHAALLCAMLCCGVLCHAVQVVPLKLLQKAPRGSTAKAFHGVKATSKLTYAESVQVSELSKTGRA